MSSRMIEDFQPLPRSLEWRVSDAYWRDKGVLPFVQREVPYRINNTGRLSDSAAEVLLANCLESNPQGRIRVLEYGAGTGLFARHLLDAFRALCAQRGLDYYDRFELTVTDGSPATIAYWAERRLFEDHRDHVVVRQADATQGVPVGHPVQAVFCNYLLCVLPAAVIRSGPDGHPEQLCVRTNLMDDAATVRSYTGLTLDEMRAIAAAPDRARLVALFPALTLFDYEVAFRAQGVDEVPEAREVLAAGRAELGVRWNFAAVACVASAAASLAPGGFVLINDYGLTQAAAAQLPLCQRFGATTALGIDFPVFEDRVRHHGVAHIRAPSGDERQNLHARLVARAAIPATEAVFEQRFGAEALDAAEGALAAVRADLQQGRTHEALAGYGRALEARPRDWSLFGEAAEIAHQAGEAARALGWADAGLGLNPCYSTWLWNLRGDALYSLERFAEAHEAYLRAGQIDPYDPRTCLNLSYTHIRNGAAGAALQAIARGLEGDGKGLFREQLLAKQRHALLALTARASGERLRLSQRLQRFFNATG
jgi:tetratricopeptide (TPR) repeat protein